MIANDFVLNLVNIFGMNLATAFKIYFDKFSLNFFLCPVGGDDESIIFVKLENPLVIFYNLRKSTKDVLFLWVKYISLVKSTQVIFP